MRFFINWQSVTTSPAGTPVLSSSSASSSSSPSASLDFSSTANGWLAVLPAPVVKLPHLVVLLVGRGERCRNS
ncbi:uncharacterized protein CIMG_05756 [Coccidioides immitis RS]|uniref:Uncharacterized protein n=1 Tax=Coccidioides immitis (strain RS) TaxID=246410 RepID=J3K6Q2_COCIM|nr:uncharacterized protein CIMG_05756 [Coccidioides immitis RS]EAS30277.3 hypothetical protein CIMG_05756 [Coccidioides immitis RS]